jgi:uncharacterized protein (TIGR02271 family)
MNDKTDSTLLPSTNTPQSDEAWINQAHQISVIEEQIQIDKKVIETGVVRVSKRVHEEHEVVNLPGSREEITVERVSINQFVETPPSIRYEGDTMIVPVLKEVVVTQTKLLLVEEVHVIKRKIEENETQEVILRKEEIVIERVPVASNAPE